MSRFPPLLLFLRFCVSKRKRLETDFEQKWCVDFNSITTWCYGTHSTSMFRHCALSAAIDSKSWSILASLVSRSTAPLHRVRHLRLFRFAFLGLHCKKAFGSLSWPIRLTWPNHLRRHRLWKTSSLFCDSGRPCFRSIEHCRYYNGIVNAQFGLQTDFAPQDLEKLSKCCRSMPNPGPQ